MTLEEGEDWKTIAMMRYCMCNISRDPDIPICKYCTRIKELTTFEERIEFHSKRGKQTTFISSGTGRTRTSDRKGLEYGGSGLRDFERNESDS